jgi:capsule polysaccharide export protein KpsE/RkpR
MENGNSTRPSHAEKAVWNFIRGILFWSGRPNTRIRRYFITFGLPLAGVWILTLAYIFLTPRSYRSEIVLNLPTATVQSNVSLQNIGQTSINATSPFASSSLSPTASYKAMALSNSTRAGAAKRLGMDTEDMPRPKVDLIDQTALMTITMNGPTPEIARERVKALYDVLQHQLDELRRDEATRRLSAIRSSVVDVEQRLNQTNQALQHYQRTSSIVSQEQFDLIVSNHETFRQKIASTDSELQKTLAERARLSQILDISAGEAAAALRFQSDPRYASLSRDLGEALVQETENRRKWGPRHPKVLYAKHRAETLKSKLLSLAVPVLGSKAETLLDALFLNDSNDRSQLFRTLVETDSHANGLKESLSRMKDGLKESAKSIEGKTSELAELAGLERQHKIAETVFASAMARIDISGQDFFSAYPLLQVVSPPSLPDRASSPKVLYALAGGILATVLLITSMVLAWLRQPFLQKILKSV